MSNPTARLLEFLESRRLLAVTLEDGVLTVTGTAAADTIELQLRADDEQVRVELNGVETLHPLADVDKIVVDALAGDDLVEYSGSDGGFNIPGLLAGRDGRDTLQGGPANDSIFGGAQNDSLEGKGGDDRLAGGKGHDVLQGGNGNDSLDGGVGNDDLWGNRGNDNLAGGIGEDDLFGGAGADSLFGNAGNDDFENRGDVFNGEVRDRTPQDDGPNFNR
jgi:Ca2+-binding RTX toxin-like protein